MIMDLISNIMIATGAAMLMIGVIGLILTRAEDKEQEEDKHGDTL